MSDAGFGGYGRLLSDRGRSRLVAAGLLARTPIAVIGFGSLYFVHSVTGSYAIGGLASGLAIAATGVVGPAAGRIADRRGQRGVLLASAIGHPLAVLGAIVFGSLGLVPLLVIFCGLCGATVAPVSAFMRARWSTLLEDPALIRTAFAVESVADELVWVFGPALAALLSSGVAEPAGLVLSGILGPVGALVLRRMPDARPMAMEHHAHEPFRLLRAAPFLVLLAISFAMGIGFGINDLTVVSMANRSGVPELAGTVLTVYSIGSASGGFLFGALSHRLHTRTALLGTCAALLITWGPLSLAADIWWLYPIGLFAGATIAPLVIAVNNAAHQIVPPAIVTEALAWLGALTVAGMSIGSVVGGTINDVGGPRLAFLVVACAAALPILLMLIFRRRFPSDDGAGGRSSVEGAPVTD